MKINEIINTQHTKFPEPYELDAAIKTKNIVPNRLGYGSYSNVYKHPNIPGMVIKQEKAFRKKEQNPFYQFVKVIEPYISGNPYLPRVYLARQEMNNKGLSKFTYVVEKLFHPILYKSYMFKTKKRQMKKDPYHSREKFGDTEETQTHDADFIKSWGATMIEGFDKRCRATGAQEALFDFTLELEDAFIEGGRSEFKIIDPKLIEALDLIKKTIVDNASSKWNSGFTHDFLTRNFLIRKTSFGPQLVLADPIST